MNRVWIDPPPNRKIVDISILIANREPSVGVMCQISDDLNTLVGNGKFQNFRKKCHARKLRSAKDVNRVGAIIMHGSKDPIGGKNGVGRLHDKGASGLPGTK